MEELLASATGIYYLFLPNIYNIMKTFESYCKEKYDEAFLDSMSKSFKANYDQAQQGVNQNYEKYADVSKQALAKAGSTAKMLSQKTGVPLPLATALIAAGLTGGATAIPFAALLYFVKQPIMKGANKVFDKTWDAGASAVQGVKNAVSRNQPQLQPESFRAFIEADSWGDWAGEKLGGAAGTVAGKASGYSSKIASSISGRIKEIGQYAKNNPKEVARMAFLVGAGAAIGAGVGKLTHDVKDLIVQKIKDYGVPQEELNWLRQNVVLDTKVDKYGQAHTGSNDELLGKPEDFASGKIYADSKPDEDTYINSQQVSTSSSAPAPKSWFGKPSANNQDIDSQYNFIGSESPSTGKSAVFSTNVEAPSSGLSHSDMGDAYRTMARTMHNNDHGGDMMKHLKDLSADPSINAAAEIKRRLASPDTYTRPAAIAGGVVGGSGNRRRT